MSGAHEMVNEAVKASPPVAVIGLALGGITLQDWVFILTLIYLVLQITWLVWSKFLRKAPDDS
jgi:hypothetical protein